MIKRDRTRRPLHRDDQRQFADQRTGPGHDFGAAVVDAERTALDDRAVEAVAEARAGGIESADSNTYARSFDLAGTVGMFEVRHDAEHRLAREAAV